MTTHVYHRTKSQRIGNTITALLAFVLVLSNVLLPRAVYGNTTETHEVVLPAGAPENHLLTSARALELPASTHTYAPPAQDGSLDVPVAAENLVSKWSGEGDASDLMGVNPGERRNGTTFTAGKIGQSFSFDGNDDYIFASGEGIDDLQELTIAAWVQIDSLTPGKIARFVTLGGEKAVLRYDGASPPHQYLHFYMQINDELQHIWVDDIVEPGSFHHVAGTYDIRTMTLYWDGAKVGSHEVEGTVARGDGVFLSLQDEPLNGALDEVAIYDRALSATEITELFSNSSSPGDNESPDTAKSPMSSEQNIQFPENYYVYMYPELPSTEYGDKIASLPPYTDQDGKPAERPYTPWLSLKYLAQAHESYRKNDFDLALAYYQLASDVMDKDWEYWSDHVMSVETNMCGSREDRIFKMIERRAHGTTNEDLIANEVLKKGQERSLAKAPIITPSYLCDSSAEFSYYYFRMFTIPISLSDVLRTIGNHNEALTRLLNIYSEDDFWGVSHNSSLEQFYGTSIGPGLSELPPKLSQYGQCVIEPEGECRHLPGVLPHPVHGIEWQLIRKKVAQTYLKWGDILYRQGNIDEAKPKYMQVLRIYQTEWENAIKLSGVNTAQYNPEVIELVERAHLQLSKMSLGLNYFGYREDYVPTWDYSYLRDNARYFIGNAKALERDALSFLDSAQKATEQDMLIEQSIGIAKKTIALEQAKSEQATKAVEISKKNYILASQRVTNTVAMISEFKNVHPIATAKGMEMDNSYVGWGADILALGDSIPIVGGLFSKPKRTAEERLQYQNMQRELKELKIAKEMADLEIDRANQELQIANIGVDIAMLDLQNKQEHRFFAQNKTLSAQFWSELSRDVREKAHQYLDYGIQLAWLAEQAYEFEYQTTVNIIKLDYLSTEKWLAADQLLLDLDAIEFRRLTLKKQKDIPITYMLSLRDRNSVAIEDLKRTGILTFDTTQQEFDLAYPGTFNRRIKNVEVAVVALVGTEGIRGTLTKAAHSLVKVNTSGIPADTQGLYPDWVQYTPSPYQLRLSRSPEETMILSVNGSTQSRLTYTDNEQGEKRIFEDHSVTGMWTLELPKYANKFDYETIYDVILKIDLVANYDAALKDVVEQEMRTLIERGEFTMGEMMGFSLAHHYPDQFYQFHNPVYGSDTASRYRLIAVPIEPQDLPPNQSNRSLTEFWLGFYGQNGPIPINAKVTSLGLNPGLDFVLLDGKLMAGGQEIDLDDLRWYPNSESGETFEPINTREGTDAVIFRTEALGELGGRPSDYWIIRIDAKDNPALSNPETLETIPEFDEQKIEEIENIIIQLAYQYEIPQYHEILFEPLDSSCVAIPSGIADIQSQWRTNEVTLDGRITNIDEWVDAGCFDLPMFKEKSGPVRIHSRWWFKNDGDWLYLLARVPKAEIEALGVYIGYFWPYPYEGTWDYSDVGWLDKDNNTWDGYGWDETQFYGDTEVSPPGENNVEGAASTSPSYYWFEFRKALNSSDGRDWS
ncbi:MAG: LamG-like jellyroll fold domain-containing protein [Caldilineaceae bacterium]